jgi:hypothetical protein
MGWRMDRCKIDGCARGLHAAGMCSTHYNRLRTTGTHEPGPKARGTLKNRFWRQVAKGAVSECWPWMSKSKIKGYGSIGLGGRDSKKELAHRVAWMLTYGDIPALDGHHGAVVRHKCSNRLCCNPAHLEIGTQMDNVKDMWANKGGPRGNAKLTEAQVAAIRSDSRSARELSPIYGVSRSHINSIRRRRCW